MKSELLLKIEPLLSVKKMSFYKENFCENWFLAYRQEVHKAKELFVYLHFFEIFLRNKIAIEFEKDFGDWLLNSKGDFKFNIYDQAKLDETKTKLVKAGKELNSDNIISNLNLGFWTNLFHKSYNYRIWQQNRMISRVFPYIKSYETNFERIQKELETIRKFRNRIFHFENLASLDFEEGRRLIGKFIFAVIGVKIDEIL